MFHICPCSCYRIRESTVLGHMAKANSHWQDFDGTRSALCLFHGPHAYISPSWYQQQPDVPTWNYAVVHAHGVPQIMQDKTELAQAIDHLINYFEPTLLDKNSKTYIPESYKKSMLDYIVGFKIPVQELAGKFKLGQNRSLADQRGLITGLVSQGDVASQQLAEFMKAYQASNKDLIS